MMIIFTPETAMTSSRAITLMIFSLAELVMTSLSEARVLTISRVAPAWMSMESAKSMEREKRIMTI